MAPYFCCFLSLFFSENLRMPEAEGGGNGVVCGRDLPGLLDKEWWIDFHQGTQRQSGVVTLFYQDRLMD